MRMCKLGSVWCACGEFAEYHDEVNGQVFCAEHAGPLAWDDITYEAYGLARAMQARDMAAGLYGEVA